MLRSIACSRLKTVLSLTDPLGPFVLAAGLSTTGLIIERHGGKFRQETLLARQPGDPRTGLPSL